VLRRSSLVECFSLLHGTGVYKASNFFFIHQYVHPCLSKNPKYTFYTIKSSLTLAYEAGTAMNARASENYLSNFKLIQCIKKCRDFLGRDILGTTFLGPNLVSFNRAVVPLFELSFLTKTQKLTSA
jgi:hypothetical protein